MLNENNCLTCAEYKAKPSVGLQEVCHKLDTVIKLLENLQVNLNINGDQCVVTLPDDSRVRTYERRM